MNTCGLIIVVLDGEFKVAQYNHYDSMPGGHGEVVLDFLKDMNREKFVEKLNNCSFVNEEKLDEMATGDLKNPILEFDIRTGADILKYIEESDSAINLLDYSEFANDSADCEWVYLINLDDNVLEVYEGKNKVGVTIDARFQGEYDESGYYPVSLRMVYDLENLPDLETFINDLDPDFFKDDEKS